MMHYPEDMITRHHQDAARAYAAAAHERSVRLTRKAERIERWADRSARLTARLRRMARARRAIV